jgi:hypothetical protein
MTGLLNTTDRALLLSASLFVWLFAAYVLVPPGMKGRGKRWAPALAGGLAALWLASIYVSVPGLWLAGALGALVYAVNAHRDTAMAVRRLPEWEIGANLVALALAAWIGFGLQVRVILPALGRALPVKAVIAFSMIGSIAILGTKVSGLVVRGVLDRAGVSPDVDEKELGRGRVIGYLERLLVIAVVALGSLEALGFLVAAKGLIRSRELEVRDFAEYFLIGTLASVGAGLVLGLLLRRALGVVR